MKLRLGILLLVASTQAHGWTNWYVDVDRTGLSANSGTNWANAWTNFESISWASLGAGHTVYVSGGYYSGQTLRVQAAGSSSSPLRIVASTEEGHNDTIIHTNGTIGAYASGNWFVFDGSKSTNVWNTLSNTLNVKSVVPTNCGWKTFGGVFNSTGGGNNCVIRGIEFGHHVTGIAPDNYGLQWNNTDPTNIVVEYCSIYHTEDNGVMISGNSVGNWDDLTFRWCYLAQTGDDCIEGQGGMTIHNCYFERERFLHGHPDGIAGVMGKTRIYNNVLVDIWDQIIYLKIWEPGTGHSGVQIVGNLIYIDQGADPVKEDGVQTASSFGWETGRTGIPASNDWGGFVFANNTFIAAGTTAAGQIRNMLDFVNGYYPTNTVYVTNSLIANNIFYQAPTAGPQLKGPATGFSYTPEHLTFAANVVHSTVSAGKGIVYRGTNYADAVQFNAGTGFSGNKSNAPAFVSVSGHNYALTNSDTTARNAGTNLASLISYWGTDLAGHSRTNDGFPDIGAFEEVSPDTHLLVWLTFANDVSSDGYFTDASGNNRHAWDYSRTTNTWGYIVPEPTNLLRIASSTYRGVNSNGYAGLFQWRTNSYDLYKRSGSFGAITNGMGAFTNLTSATIACWIKYNHYSNAVGVTDWDGDAQGTVLDAGTSGGGNSWGLGRHNLIPGSVNQTRFWVMTNNLVAPERAWLDFPDTTNNATGDSFSWHHYAVVFASGKLTNYYDGVVYTNGSINPTSLGCFRNDLGTPFWIGVGVRTHGGTPALDDEGSTDYPNDGWFNGAMDDVRIYDRVLSATEIAALAGAGDSPAGPPAKTTSEMRVGTLRVGAISLQP